MSLKDYDQAYATADVNDKPTHYTPPVGDHVVELRMAEWGTSKAGNDMLVVEFAMIAHDAGKTFRHFRVVDQKYISFLKQDLTSLGFSDTRMLSSITGLELSSLIGKRYKVRVSKKKKGEGVDIWINGPVTPNASPQQQPPQQPARQADEYATDPSDFGAGSEDLPF